MIYRAPLSGKHTAWALCIVNETIGKTNYSFRAEEGKFWRTATSTTKNVSSNWRRSSRRRSCWERNPTASSKRFVTGVLLNFWIIVLRCHV